jgi:glycosyltransferase involved in cell wall biosynthesis
VGRLCEQKGQLLLLEAAAILHRRGIDFELVLAGDGEMRAEVERAIARDGLASKVTITGWISSSQVREQLLGSRALVLPSFAEGLPVVIMEAMALTRPVISTFVAGIPELIRPGLDGWLVPAGDTQALADAMARCLGEDVESLERMGRHARERVLARHDVDSEAAKLRTAFGAGHSVPLEPAP